MQAKPTEKELARRITEQLRHRASSDACNLLWHGYLAACIEWGLLTPNEHLRLSEVLRDVGGDEIREIFLGLDKSG